MADEKFYYTEGNTSVKDIIKNLTKEITTNAGVYNWGLEYPSKIEDVTDFSLIKATTSYGKDFYVRFERAAAINPSSSDKGLLDKEKNAQALTDDEIKLLHRYLENTELNSLEKTLIKKKTTDLTSEEQAQMQEIRLRKKITNDRELELLKKFINGESLSTTEQNELDTFKNVHTLTAQELKDWNTLKANKQFHYDDIVLIMYKQYGNLKLIESEQRSLANYRASMELSQEEKEKLTILKSQLDNRNHMYITIGKEIHDTKRIIEKNKKNEEIQVKDLVEESCSVPSRLAWYKKLTKDIGDWLPVQYWLNITKDAVNIVLRGDPSADNYPYSDYLTSYAYIGAVKPMEDSASTDDIYNFGVTTGSDIQPFFTKKFGERTATGITDVCMIANKIGMPIQPHYPGFYTTHSFMDKCNTEGSRWNHKKHQFSDITLVHPVDMERGKMINVLAGDASAIYDMDKLVYKKDTAEEENYKKFKLTSPYCFLNNSANNLYCIAIRCYKTAE